MSHPPSATVRSEAELTPDLHRVDCACRIPGTLRAMVREALDFLARRTALSGTLEVEMNKVGLRETRYANQNA